MVLNVRSDHGSCYELGTGSANFAEQGLGKRPDVRLAMARAEDDDEHRYDDMQELGASCWRRYRRSARVWFSGPLYH